MATTENISIHVLREEDDIFRAVMGSHCKISIHVLREEDDQVRVDGDRHGR